MLPIFYFKLFFNIFLWKGIKPNMKKIKNSFKKYILPLIFLIFTLNLILFSNTNITAARNGLILWANNVVPTLFPFFIATELLSYTNVCEKISVYLSKIIRPLFNCPGCGAYAFILGLISGYPVGAKIVTSLYNNGMCTKDEANRMLAFTNNSGPLFIVGTVGITLFRNSVIGILFLITHILASITVGIILGLLSKFNHTEDSNSVEFSNFNSSIKYCTFSNLGEVIGNSIFSSIKTILMVGGFIVLFSCIISIFNSSHVIILFEAFFSPLFRLIHLDTSFIKPCITGLLELTNGLSLVCQIPCKKLSINIIICAFLLGFGGLSILLQAFIHIY